MQIHRWQRKALAHLGQIMLDSFCDPLFIGLRLPMVVLIVTMGSTNILPFSAILLIPKKLSLPGQG
jgi:hypothetical protein